MNIIDLLDKNERLQVNMIRRILLNGGKIKVRELQDAFNVNYVAVVNSLQEIIYQSQPFATKIQWTFKESVIELTTAYDFSVNDLIFHYLQQSINYQIIEAVFNNDKRDVFYLAETLSISESSLYRRIKYINEMITEYNIKIKNLRFVGSELQIRYFMFQLLWHSNSLEQLAENAKHSSIQSLVSLLEESIHTNFSPLNRVKLMLWLKISRRRLEKQEQALHLKETRFFPLIGQEEYYLQIKEIYYRYLSRFAFRVKEEEILYLYLFLSSKFMLSEKNAMYLALVQADQSVYEPVAKINGAIMAILKNYFPTFKDDEPLYNQVLYDLTQMHLQLLLFDGYCIYFDEEAVHKRENDLIDNRLLDFAQTLINKTAGLLDKELSKDSKEVALWRYTSIVAQINHAVEKEITVGFDFHSNTIVREVLIERSLQLFCREVSVQGEQVQLGKEYDLIITDSSINYTKYQSQYVYYMTDLETEYDIQRINELLVKIYRGKNEEIA